MLTLTTQQKTRIRRKVLGFYREKGRRLPFRETTDPYCITVSEIMLQQTQVDRVVPKYEDWIQRWPDWISLARATNRQLLAEWSGLGYNRRALNLRRIARIVRDEYDGALPQDVDALLALPGIGAYTARAILIFAFNQRLTTIDTNIRRVILHECDLQSGTPDGEIQFLAAQLLPRKDARSWHYALMDYSAIALPRRLPGVTPRSRQTPFEGSLRQIRGEIVRQLAHKRSVRLSTIVKACGRSESDVVAAAKSLVKDGMVICTDRTVRLTDDNV